MARRGTPPPPDSADDFLDEWLKNNTTSTTVPGTQSSAAPPRTQPGAQNTTGSPFAGLTEEDLRDVIIKAQRAVSNAQRVGIPEPTATEIIETGERPDTGFATWIPGLKATGGFLKRTGGAIVPDVLDVSDIPLPFTDKNLGEAVVGAGGAALRGVGRTLRPAYEAYTFGTRFFTGVLREAYQEIDVWRGASERGEMQYAPVPRELRKPIGPGGIFRGGPQGREALEYPKEGREMGKAGFQWSEVMQVANDPNTGIGNTLWRDVTGNPYADQLVGFIGEIVMDPVNLLSAGVGGAVTKGSVRAAGLAPDAFRAANLASDALRAQGKAAVVREIALEALDAAKAAGVSADIAKAETVLAKADEALAATTRAVKGPKAPRVRGRDGAGALAQRLVDQRNAALKVLEDAKANPAIYAPEQIGLARYTVDVITDEVIAKTASRGFAGLIPSLGAAFKKPSKVESLLGVSGKLRIGLGPLVAEIPGTGRITRPFTYAVQAGREGIASRIGIGAIVPTGEGGLFPAGLRRERAALRTGAVGADDALRNLEFQKLDRAFRGNRVRYARDAVSTLARYGFTARGQRGLHRNISKVFGKTMPAEAGFTKADLNSVLPYVTNTAARAGATLTPAQQKALAAIEGVLNDFYEQARNVAEQTGRDLGYIPNYFPQMLSDEALTAIRSGGKPATDAAKNLRISDLEARGNFTPRSLEIGDDFFGHTLTADDLAGGVVRLNEIAKAGGWKYGKFFEEDVLTVLTKYANRHADDLARQTVLSQAPALAPKQFARELEESKTLVIKAFDPDRAKTAFRKYAEAKAARVKSVDPARVTTLIDDFERNIDDIAAMGLDPASAVVLQDNLLKAANLDLNELLYGVKDSPFDLNLERFATADEIIDRGFVSIGENAPDIFADPRVLELFNNVKTITGDPDYTKALLAYYDQKLGFMKAYMLATPRQVALNVIGNWYMMTLAGGAKVRYILEGRTIYKQIIDMARGGVPIDDAVKMVSAKLKPKGALGRVGRVRAIPTEAEADLLRMLGRPVPPTTMAPTGVIDDFIEQAVADAYAQYGGAGFGRYGEVGAEIGADVSKPGMMLRGPARGLRIPEEIRFPGGYKAIPLRPSGKGPVGRVIKKGLDGVSDAMQFATRGPSRAVGTVPTTTRRVAQSIEDSQRFEFMWDGLRQGLTPDEAAARVKYYLFDYQDYTKLDAGGRRLFPFWMWMSRNTPLQLVLSMYNPRAYLWADKVRRATEEEEAQEFGSDKFMPLPAYMRERGAYITKDMEGFGAPLSNIVVDFSLPIVGYGEKNFFTEFLNNYEGGIIGPLTPAVRVPLELYANRIAAFRDPLVYPNDSDPTSKRIEYAFRQTFGMPVSLLSRYLGAIDAMGEIPGLPSPELRKQQFIQVLFDLRFDENQPGDQALAAAARIFGFPLQPLPRTSVQESVIRNNTRELENYVKAVEEGRSPRPPKQEQGQPQAPTRELTEAERFLDEWLKNNPSPTTIPGQEQP